ESTKSAPVAKDNLEVVVVATKKSFAANETPTFEFTYTNRTPKDPKAFQAFKLFDIGFEVRSWSCIDAKGRTFKIEWPREFAARQPVQTAVLEAGQSQVQKQSMVGSVKAGDAQAESLPPGKYRVSATISFSAGKEEKPTGIRFWTGEMVTAPVTIEIAEK